MNTIEVIKNKIIGFDITPEEFNFKFMVSYAILDDGCVVIDPGPMNTSEKLINTLSSFCDDVKLIILTHIHIDHSGAVSKLAKRYSCIILVHPNGYKHIVNPEKLWNISLRALGDRAWIYGKPEPCQENILRTSSDNMELVFNEITLKIIFTPGHAHHHQSIYIPEYQVLFPGDAAGVYDSGKNIIIPTFIMPKNLQKYISSLDKMISLKPKYICYPHFGVLKNLEILVHYREAINKWIDLLHSYNPKNLEEAKNVLLSDKTFGKIYEGSVNNEIYSMLINLSINTIYNDVIRENLL